MFFDEFAVSERPSLFYGWAERNTRPQVKSNERARNKLNGLLCVDAHSGEEYFALSPQAKTEDISEYNGTDLSSKERATSPDRHRIKTCKP